MRAFFACAVSTLLLWSTFAPFGGYAAVESSTTTITTTTTTAGYAVIPDLSAAAASASVSASTSASASAPVCSVPSSPFSAGLSATSSPAPPPESLPVDLVAAWLLRDRSMLEAFHEFYHISQGGPGSVWIKMTALQGGGVETITSVETPGVSDPDLVRAQINSSSSSLEGCDCSCATDESHEKPPAKHKVSLFCEHEGRNGLHIVKIVLGVLWEAIALVVEVLYHHDALRQKIGKLLCFVILGGLLVTGFFSFKVCTDEEDRFVIRPTLEWAEFLTDIIVKMFAIVVWFAIAEIRELFGQ